MSPILAQAVFWGLTGLMTALSVIVLVRAFPVPADRATSRLSLGLTLFVPVVALGLYVLLGHPELTAWRTRPMVPPFLAGAVEKLQADTIANPDDATAFALLGDVDRKLQHYDEAVIAYRKAQVLVPGNAQVSTGLAEVLVQQAGGKITPEASALFAASPKLSQSRYYLALAKSQAADWEGALADWQALAKDTVTDDPLYQPTMDHIAEARRVLGVDPEH